MKGIQKIIATVSLLGGLFSWGCGAAINLDLAGDTADNEASTEEAAPVLTLGGTLEVSASVSASISPGSLVVAGPKGLESATGGRADPAFYGDIDKTATEEAEDVIDTATSLAPAGIIVQLLDCEGNLLDESETDETGSYHLEIPVADWEGLAATCEYLVPYAWVGSEEEGSAVTRVILMSEVTAGQTDFSIDPSTTLAVLLAFQDSTAGDGEFDPRLQLKGMKRKRLPDPSTIMVLVDKILERVTAMEAGSSQTVCGASAAKLGNSGKGTVLAMIRDIKKWIYQGTALSDSRSAGQGMKAMVQLIQNLIGMEACQADLEGPDCESTLIVFLNKTFSSSSASSVQATKEETTDADWEMPEDDVENVMGLLKQAGRDLQDQFLDAVRRDTTGYLPNLFLNCTEIAPLLAHTEDQAKITYLHSIGETAAATEIRNKLVMEDCVAYIVSLVDNGVAQTNTTFKTTTTLTCGSASVAKDASGATAKSGTGDSGAKSADSATKDSGGRSASVGTGK